MNDDDLNLPQRKVIIPEVVNSTEKEIEKFRFTEKQVDVIVSIGARAFEDMGQIIKDIVAIARIQEQSAADVSRIKEETQKIVQTVRVEIDRLTQVGQNIRTRGQIAIDLLAQILDALKYVPDLDEGSRHRLIDSIFPIIAAAIR